MPITDICNCNRITRDECIFVAISSHFGGVRILFLIVLLFETIFSNVTVLVAIIVDTLTVAPTTCALGLLCIDGAPSPRDSIFVCRESSCNNIDVK